MKNNQYNRLRSIVMTLIVTSMLISSVMAQSTVKSSTKLERERISRIMDPNTSVEEFRAEMKNYLTDLGNALSNFQAIPAVRKQYAKNGFDPVTALERTKADFDKIPAEGLMKMREVYAKYPEWRESPRAIYEITQRVSNRTYTKGAADKNSGSITVNVITPDSCPDISVTPSYADIAITKGFEIAGEGIMNALPTDALTVAAHAVAAGVLAGLKGATLATETLRSQYEDCSRAAFEADITGKVNAIPGQISASTSTTATNITNAQTTIIANDDANKTTIVNNDNANTLALTNLINATRTAIINNANDNKDEVKNLLLRTQIEADLASTDGSAFVALYETPSNVCLPALNDKGMVQLAASLNAPSPTQCGLLDLVRSIVRDTIANVGAGTNAQSFFNTAVAQQNAGQYKAAYASYRKAYKAAGK
jgi:hypothetical protein